MEAIKILVVEDEIVVADNICSILENLGYQVIEPVINYTEAVKSLHEESPDLAILDIQLAGKKDGIDLALYIKENINIPFIFLTSNADPRTVGRAKELNPPAYLVKPFNRDDLFASIELALHNHDNTFTPSSLESTNPSLQNTFFIKDRNVFHKVFLKDILYVKSDHVYVEIFTIRDKKFVMRKSLNEFVNELPVNFFRVHRSFAINLTYLESIHSSYLKLEMGQEIPIGKVYRDELMKQIDVH